jgi:hypothetical protein
MNMKTEDKQKQKHISEWTLIQWAVSRYRSVKLSLTPKSDTKHRYSHEMSAMLYAHANPK